VAEEIYARGLTDQPRPADLPAHILAHMVVPEYPDYTPGLAPPVARPAEAA